MRIEPLCRDITPYLLTEVCNEVCVEPDLQAVTPQPTVRIVQGWMCQPMESDVVGFRRPTLM